MSIEASKKKSVRGKLRRRKKKTKEKNDKRRNANTTQSLFSFSLIVSIPAQQKQTCANAGSAAKGRSVLMCRGTRKDCRRRRLKGKKRERKQHSTKATFSCLTFKSENDFRFFHFFFCFLIISPSKKKKKENDHRRGTSSRPTGSSLGRASTAHRCGSSSVRPPAPRLGSRGAETVRERPFC